MSETFDSLTETFREDCRHFRPDRPCLPHKLEGRTCPACDRYEPAPDSLLIVKLAAAGDVLRTTALLPAIRRDHPQARIVWVTRPESEPLLRGNALVDEVVTTARGEVPVALLARSFDHVFCPDADAEAAALASVARARERRGFALDGRGRVLPLSPAAELWYRMGIRDDLKRANDRSYQDLIGNVLGLRTPVVERPLLALSEAETRAARAFRAAAGIPPEATLVGINTGAGGRWEYKRWTLPHQERFVAGMHARGHAVLLLGGPAEERRHAELLAAARGLRVFDAGTRNSVRDFAARVGLCDVVVTGDTMALHIAVALGKPVVALFGPTSAAEIELYGAGEKIQPPGLDCLVCYLSRCDKSPYCQELIDPERVASAVEAQLARRT
jgi:heptosyltransferase-2